MRNRIIRIKQLIGSNQLLKDEKEDAMSNRADLAYKTKDQRQKQSQNSTNTINVNVTLTHDSIEHGKNET